MGEGGTPWRKIGFSAFASGSMPSYRLGVPGGGAAAEYTAVATPNFGMATSADKAALQKKGKGSGSPLPDRVQGGSPARGTRLTAW